MTHRLRVTIVDPAHPPVVANPENPVLIQVHYLASHLAKLGVDVRVVARRHAGRLTTPYRVVEFEGLPIRGHGWYREALSEVLYASRAARHILRAADDQDVLHAYSYATAALVAARPSSVRIVTSFGHAVPAVRKGSRLLGSGYPMPSPLQFLTLRMQRFLAHRASARTANSILLRDRLSDAWNIPRAAIDVLPQLGVDLASFSPQPKDPLWMARLGIKDDDVVVLCVARLAAYKNQLLLTKVARRMIATSPKIKFLLFGPPTDPQYASSLKEQIRLLGVERHFVIPEREMPHEDLPAIYSLADIYAQPSTDEGMPTTLLEAMACALPIVASDIPQHREASPDGSSIRFAGLDDVPGWLSRLEELIARPALRLELGQSARTRIHEAYSWEVVAAGYLALYERLCRDGPVA